MTSSGYTRRQWVTLVTFSVAQFFNAVCVSLQAPFYPAEAERKGATATQYGLVFGVFELTVFVVSPIYGKFLNRWGAKRLNNAGIATVSVMCVLFGLLDRVEDTTAFIGLSFAIRIVEAMGNAAFVTSAFSIIAKEFPKNVGSAFATMETFFGLGLIAGPTVGGALFELGGYSLPFVVCGGILMAAALVTCCLLPKENSEGASDASEGGGQLLAALKLPSIMLAVFAIMAASCSIGFLQATLEPHLRPLKLSPLQLGLMFVLNGATYALSAPCWGWLCDRKASPRVVTALGAVVVVVAFTFVGPMPFLPLDTSLNLCIGALVTHGVGFGAELVATFSGAHRDALAHGFPDDLSTYGLVSGIWTSTFALGCFIGPSVGGALLDTIGFKWATVVVAALHALVALVTALFVITGIGKTPENPRGAEDAHSDDEKTRLLSGDGDGDSTYGSAVSSQEYQPI